MKFFQKRGVAIFLLVLMIIAGLVIGIGRGEMRKKPAAAPEMEYDAAGFTGYVEDESGSLSDNTKQMIRQLQADTYGRHKSAVALVMTEGLSSLQLEQEAERRFVQMDLSERDMLFLVDMESESWYCTFGYDMEDYVNSDMEHCFTSNIDAVLDNPENGVVQLYEALLVWYDDNVPAYRSVSTETVTGFIGSVIGTIFFTVIVVILLVVLLVVKIARAGTLVVRSPRVVYRGPSVHRPPNPGPSSFRTRSSGSHSSRSGFGGSRSSGRSGFGGSRGGSRGGFGGKR